MQLWQRSRWKHGRPWNHREPGCHGDKQSNAASAGRERPRDDFDEPGQWSRERDDQRDGGPSSSDSSSANAGSNTKSRAGANTDASSVRDPNSESGSESNYEPNANSNSCAFARAGQHYRSRPPRSIRCRSHHGDDYLAGDKSRVHGRKWRGAGGRLAQDGANSVDDYIGGRQLHTVDGVAEHNTPGVRSWRSAARAELDRHTGGAQQRGQRKNRGASQIQWNGCGPGE